MSRVIQLTDNGTSNPVLVDAATIETAKGGANGTGPTTVQLNSGRTEVVVEDVQTMLNLAGQGRLVQVTDNVSGFPVLISGQLIETVKGGAGGDGPTTVTFNSNRTEVYAESIADLIGLLRLVQLTDNGTGNPVLVGDGQIEKAIGGANGAGPTTITFNSARTEVVSEDVQQVATVGAGAL